MTELSPSALRFKAEAALISLAAGDALGWPQELRSKVTSRSSDHSVTTEFRSWIRRGGGRYYPHEERIHAGEYSDDTQLALAVGRSLILGGMNWWKRLTRVELPLWTLYERGGGGATKRAASMWTAETPPWKVSDSSAVKKYFDAGGNGVAMRVLPHSIFYAFRPNPEALMRDIVTDGVATHGHPRALVGATAYAFAAWWLLRSSNTLRFGELVKILRENVEVWGSLPASRNGWLEAANRSMENYEHLWSKVVDEMQKLLDCVQGGLDKGVIADDDKILRDLGCFGKFKGAGTVSTAAAIYLCSRYAAQPIQAVIKAAFASGADTDTIAAMSGGLVGCLAGRDWIPSEWDDLQDYEYLCRMASDLARGPSESQNRLSSLQPVAQRDLDKLRSAVTQGHKGGLSFDGTRRVEIIDSVNLKSLSTTTLGRAWKLRTSDGQTIYITRLGRKPKDNTPLRTQRKSNDKSSQSSRTERANSSATTIGLKLTVANLNAMASFYECVLGLQPKRRSDHSISYGGLSLVDTETASNLLNSSINIEKYVRRHQIQVHVNDLSAALRRVEKSEGKVLQPIAEAPRKERFFLCADPEGNLIEVVEYR